MSQQFKALRVVESNGLFESVITTRDLHELDVNGMVDGVLINVHYSSLNYKDMLSMNGNRGVTKNYPHTPGIDAAGVVAEGRGSFRKGDNVIVTGYDLGMNTSGGFAEYIKVPDGWVVPLPKRLTLRRSMCYGTAGFTAAESVHKVVSHVSADDGDILVTGVTGGVGYIAMRILLKLGYSVIAATSKVDLVKPELISLGVKEVITTKEIFTDEGKAMLKERWAGAIDTVGGEIVSHIIKSTALHGVVTTCGNIFGDKFCSSIYPFILRGVSLCGVTSASTRYPQRKYLWSQLAGDWSIDDIEQQVDFIDLSQIKEKAEQMKNGTNRRRNVIKI